MELTMKPNRSDGLLFTFCGLDGCGKTTQIRLLTRYLADRGLPVCLTRQPTDFVRESEIFRNYMDTPEHGEFDYRALSLLCASDRVQHSNRVIARKLEEGNIVISDRYFYSCLANLRARGYAQDSWIYEIARFIPKPDIAFFLDVDVETAVRRVRAREEERDRYIDLPLQHRLRAEYLAISAENDSVLLSTAGEDEDQCFRRVRCEVDRLV